MDDINAQVEKHAHHRNGISGAPFDIILFKEDNRKMIGIVFEEEGHVAALDRDLLSKDIIEFTKNSWRGDRFEPILRRYLIE